MKAIKIITALAIPLMFGCTPNSLQMAQQDQACSSYGGVYKYSRFAGEFSSEVTCKNGTYHKWDSTEISKEFHPND